MNIIFDFWTILVSMISSIVNCLFYMLKKRDFASAKTERTRQARKDLLNFIESYIINKQKISEETIYNLRAALEREYQVSLEDIFTPIELLQDVELRIQKSMHLSNVQKKEHIFQIEKIIADIKKQHNVQKLSKE